MHFPKSKIFKPRCSSGILFLLLLLPSALILLPPILILLQPPLSFLLPPLLLSPLVLLLLLPPYSFHLLPLLLLPCSTFPSLIFSLSSRNFTSSSSLSPPSPSFSSQTFPSKQKTSLISAIQWREEGGKSLFFLMIWLFPLKPYRKEGMYLNL